MPVQEGMEKSPLMLEAGKLLKEDLQVTNESRSLMYALHHLSRVAKLSGGSVCGESSLRSCFKVQTVRTFPRQYHRNSGLFAFPLSVLNVFLMRLTKQESNEDCGK